MDAFQRSLKFSLGCVALCLAFTASLYAQGVDLSGEAGEASHTWFWLPLFFAAIVVVAGLGYWLGKSSQQPRLRQLNDELAESKTSQLALQTSKQRYATLFNAAEDAIFLIDNGKIVDCNQAAAQMFGCSPITMINKCLFHWSPSFQPDGFDSADKGRDLLHSTQDGASQLFDWLYQRQDGVQFHAEVRLTPCDAENTHYVLAIVRDISERKRIESLKDEFISTVSHEIRTPLTSILGSLKLVLSGSLKASEEQSKMMLGIANNNAERLLALVNDLLDIQKLASKHSQLTYVETHVATFLSQAVANNQAYAKQHNVTLALEDVPQDCYALIDQARLMQVMNNLLSNAAKFSHPDSQVVVKTEVIGFMLRVSVIDHGLGIPEKFQPHVFERFTQADSTSTRKIGGTGLGLNIAQAIVDQHGGQLRFESKEGEGTTFYFDLPFETMAKSAQVG